MARPYANPDRKSFDRTPMSELVFASANIMELAGYHDPEMAPNVKTTKRWRTPDFHQSMWQLESIQDPDRALAEKFSGVSPVEYRLLCQTIGSKTCFVYRSDTEWLRKLDDDGETNYLIPEQEKLAQIPYFLEGMSGFPKDNAIADLPLLESWSVPHHELSGVDYNSSVFETIAMTSLSELANKHKPSLKAKRGIVRSILDWLNEPVN